MALASILTPKTKRIPELRVSLGICLMVWSFGLFPTLALAHAASQAQAKQPLGSLSAVGQVYVGNSAVPAESTIFTGDTLRTDPTATASFTIGGKGSFAIASNSQLVFIGTQQYVAELKSGIVVMSSESGPSGISLRTGNYVVVAVTRGEPSTSKIESEADGSFLISCSEGSTGIVPLEGSPNGVFLQKGQSVTISPQGELSAPTATVATTTTPAPASTQTTPTAKKNNHTGLIILGVAGGAGAIAAAAAAGHGGGGQTVSTSTP